MSDILAILDIALLMLTILLLVAFSTVWQAKQTVKSGLAENGQRRLLCHPYPDVNKRLPPGN